MKLLIYCFFCFLAMRVQSKPQITKLFPIEELVTYHQRLSNNTKPLDKFLGKLRATYNFVFRQPDNTSNVEKILTKDASNSNLEALKLTWINATKLGNYSDLKYPNNSFLDQVKSLSILKNYESMTNSNGLENSSIGILPTIIKENKNSANLKNSDKESSNETKTLDNEYWFNDIQPLGQLELQDEELDKNNEVEVVTSKTTFQLPATVGRHLIEWLGSLLSLTYGIYTKLSSTLCSNGKIT